MYIYTCILSLLLPHYSAIKIFLFYSFLLHFFYHFSFCGLHVSKIFAFFHPFSSPSHTSHTLLLAAACCCWFFVTIALSFARAWPLLR